MTPITEMTTAQLFDQLVLNTRAMATICEEMYPGTEFPDPRVVADLLERMSPAQYFATIRLNHEAMSRMHQMLPMLLSIMGDLVELEGTVLARIEEGA